MRPLDELTMYICNEYQKKAANMSASPDTLVTGASGLIGRWLVPLLTRRGHTVLVPLRGARARAAEYLAWTAGHGGDTERLVFDELDLSRDDLGLTTSVAGIRDVFHLAGRYQFGMSVEEARSTNVEGSLRALRLAAQAPQLRRFTSIGGYRVADPRALRAAGEITSDEAARRRLYKRLGAYEASKVEENVALRAEARRLAVPISVVNPSTVIGDSGTGETTQFIGLTEAIRDLAKGALPALVEPMAFVPVVTVDYLAQLLAGVPEHADGPETSYWVLDEKTPLMGDLLRHVARRLGVKVPRLTLPVRLVAALPRALTRVEPETLSFLSTDTYDTAGADALARKLSLTAPDTLRALDRWVDFLVSVDFGRRG
ncbi:MAG: SDR family oxidoreductase [Pseudomonadota bacterium]|nr:SDR family oxidoreductase [Pseudomonadota bacterium]